MLLYEVKNIIKIIYDKENELLIHDWLHYNPEDNDDLILTVLQRIYDIFLIYPVEKVIVKTDFTIGVFSPSIQEYIRDVQFPRLIADTNLRFVATIKSKDNMKAIGALLWQDQFDEEAEIYLHDVSSEEEARIWLSTISNKLN